MKRIFICLFACLLSFLTLSVSVFSENAVPVSEGGAEISVYDPFGEELISSAEALGLECVSAVLMEEKTGTVL